MIATLIYVLTVIYVSYTLYKYITYEDTSKITNCFDEGVEEFLGIIRSDEYEYH